MGSLAAVLGAALGYIRSGMGSSEGGSTAAVAVNGASSSPGSRTPWSSAGFHHSCHISQEVARLLNGLLQLLGLSLNLSFQSHFWHQCGKLAGKKVLQDRSVTSTQTPCHLRCCPVPVWCQLLPASPRPCQQVCVCGPGPVCCQLLWQTLRTLRVVSGGKRRTSFYIVYFIFFYSGLNCLICFVVDCHCCFVLLRFCFCFI